MKFRFEDQPHQAAAISAVTDLFEGVLTPPAAHVVGQAPGAEGHAGYRLDRDALAEQLAIVTKRENVDTQNELQLLAIDDLQDQPREFPNISVEMETGTGKTYVYIATALRLAQTHGLRKFVILVHSVAIRAGVVKTFEQTEEHFRAKFPSLPYQWGVLGEGSALDDFLEPSSTVQFLVASVQAIDKPKSGVVYQEAEQAQLWGVSGSGIALIAATSPVVIIDEPQNFATDLRKRALATLNPLVALRYSATHKEPYNLVHRLGAKAATDAGLVKRVSVKGVVGGSTGEAFLRLDRLRTKNKRLFAEATIDVAGAGRTPVVLQNGDDLFETSEGLDQYRGMVIERFERKPDRIVFENGTSIALGEEVGIDRAAVWEDQIRHTIRAHLDRQAKIDATLHEVKVLSLFFVEHVADYYGDDAVIPEMFDRIFMEEWARSPFRGEDAPNPADLRVHYFPSTKTGLYKDATGNSKDDEEQKARAFQEIVANKELILTKSNPRAFIFSHSALKEGWDNPNVFQIGFLRHSASEIERRQQVGRGLRIPVDEHGNRVADPHVARLTLVVDETFAEFRKGINAEYAAAGGGGDAPDIEDADTTVVVKRRPDRFESEEFKQLWKRIRYRARYRITLDAAVLPDIVAASEHLDDLKYIAKRANIIQTAEIEYDEHGKVVTLDSTVVENKGTSIVLVGQRLPDLVRLIEDQLLASKFPLQLTRPTIAAIVRAIPDALCKHAIDDPERWARTVAHAIRTVTIEELVKHIGYEPDPEDDWWDAEVVFLAEDEQSPQPAKPGVDPQNGVTPARDDGTNLYDHVIYDSHVERRFAQQLENDGDHVKLFTKLPRRFRVRTPVGEYSPDWAILYDNDGTERLYLVRETKGTLRLDDLTWDEAMRIRFARRHFEIAPEGDVDYQITTDKDGLRIAENWDDQTS